MTNLEICKLTFPPTDGPRDLPSCCIQAQGSFSKSASAATTMTRARILLADDNPPILEVTAKALVSSFDVVGMAHNGRELIAKALLLTPDVIVVDITMPIMSGIEAARQIRKAGLAARLVFLTIHRENEFILACLEEGALGYVNKAHIREDLIPAIDAAMAGKLFISPSLSPDNPQPHT